MKYLSLFSGVEGGGLAFQHLIKPKITCIGYVENEDYCQRVIRQRQIDGLLDKAPIYGDIRTFIDSGCAELYRGIADVIAGGFPCQDISCANPQGEGISGARSGLWSEMAEVVRQVRPDYVFVENSPTLIVRGFDTVLKDLAKMGFDARWGCISASQCGAFHKRERIWIVADSNSKRLQGRHNSTAKKNGESQDTPIQTLVQSYSWPNVSDPHAHGSNDGLPCRVDRTKACGEAWVPQVAALAWEILSN